MLSHLDAVAEEYGFEEYEEILRRYVRPAVGFDFVGDEPEVGASKLGGGPDMPEGFEWPMHKGRPLDFLLQVRLEDVAEFPGAEILPKSGLLSFFYDIAEQPWGFDPANATGHRVIYTPAGTPLVRYSPTSYDWLPEPSGLTFWHTETLPGYGTIDGDRMEAELSAAGAEEDEDWEVAATLVASYAPEPTTETLHYLGGHAANIQNGMELEAQLATHGYYLGNSWPEGDARAEELAKGATDWRLVLQLDSDEGFQMMWGDLGRLYFWARKEDLKRGDFSRTWMTLQCS